jgi:hypothetical protein
MYRKSEISLIRKKKTGLSRAVKIGKNTPTRCEKSASSHLSISLSFGFEFVVKIQRLQCTYLQIIRMKVRRVVIIKLMFRLVVRNWPIPQIRPHVYSFAASVADSKHYDSKVYHLSL